MSDPQLPPRPAPPRRLGEAAQAWLVWFGVGRLLLAALSVAVVAGGLFWLVRAQPPPVEATLPTSSTGSVPAATLPVPTAPLTDAVSAGTTGVAAGPVLVHVAGEVRSPGVYELDGGDRVDDAVRSAGGPTSIGDLDGLNLAAPVVDGQRIYVPAAGEIDPAVVPTAAPIAPGGTTGGPIDLNVATVEQLETLPGVGPATAAAIVDDRDRNGPFASVDDLDRVPGIGPAKLAAIRDLVTV